MNHWPIKFVAAVAVLVGLASRAQAGFVLTVEPQGNNVFATGSGSIDLSDLTADGTGNDGAYICGGQGVAAVGDLPSGDNAPFYYDYSGFGEGPSAFGSFIFSIPNSDSGNFVEMQALSNAVVVPVGYVSNAPLSGTATFDNTTISAMGLTPGSYTWTWGTDDPADFFTLNIDTVAVPEPSSFVLAALSVLGMLAVARRRA
jgi:hypothetical protein